METTATTVHGTLNHFLKERSAGTDPFGRDNLLIVREGRRRSGDRPPNRFHEPLPYGRLKGVSISGEEFEEALTLLNQMKGRDPETTIPTRAKLLELDLGWVADDLQAAGVPVR